MPPPVPAVPLPLPTITEPRASSTGDCGVSAEGNAGVDQRQRVTDTGWLALKPTFPARSVPDASTRIVPLNASNG
ncbi:MAG: hypothetical protein H6Q89_5169 [Myxococcaceae bacterium]|nr:hypothetical protein [Myxococcaceae bacterium]